MYPWPRAAVWKKNKKNPTHYHYQWPKPGDLGDRIKQVFDFIAANPNECETQMAVMYSWNEFSEGGGLCPTMGESPGYEPNTVLLDEAAKALSSWKYKAFTSGRFDQAMGSKAVIK